MASSGAEQVDMECAAKAALESRSELTVVKELYEFMKGQ